MKEYLSPKELAEHLNISIHTIYLWTSQRTIPYFKLGKIVRFDLTEIDAWLETKRVELYKNN